MSLTAVLIEDSESDALLGEELLEDAARSVHQSITVHWFRHAKQAYRFLKGHGAVDFILVDPGGTGAGNPQEVQRAFSHFCPRENILCYSGAPEGSATYEKFQRYYRDRVLPKGNESEILDILKAALIRRTSSHGSGKELYELGLQLSQVRSKLETLEEDYDELREALNRLQVSLLQGGNDEPSISQMAYKAYYVLIRSTVVERLTALEKWRGEAEPVLKRSGDFWQWSDRLHGLAKWINNNWKTVVSTGSAGGLLWLLIERLFLK